MTPKKLTNGVISKPGLNWTRYQTLEIGSRDSAKKGETKGTRKHRRLSAKNLIKMLNEEL